VKPTNPWAEHFQDLAKKILPRDGSIDIWSDDSGRMVLQSSWRFPADATGARKRTHPIRVVVTQEALEDYSSTRVTQAERAQAEERFQDWLKVRLRAFTPQPSQPIGGPPPEEWVVGPHDLFPVPS